MKLMAAGVTFSAAMVRSPSFSRSSSSHRMIIFPAWMSWIASSIVLNAMGDSHPPGSLGKAVSAEQGRGQFPLGHVLTFQTRLQDTLDVFAHHITLEIYGRPLALATKRGDGC